MRLTSLVTGNLRNLASALEKCGIRTESDLLHQPIIEVFRRLPPGTASLLDLEELVERITEKSSACGISAANLLDQDMDNDAPPTTLLSGTSDLDKLLDGLGSRRVLEFSGNQNSGKVFLVLHLILRHLCEHPESSVVWIDTTGDFSIDLAAEILENCESSNAASTALDRLQVTLAFDLESAYRALDELEVQSYELTGSRTTCVVINQVTSLLGPNLSAVSAQGHAIMTDFMRRLTYMSRSHGRNILVLNNSTAIKSKSPMVPPELHKPALGPSFAFLTDATLWLERTGEAHDDAGRAVQSLHKITALRSRNSPSGVNAMFGIREGKLLGSPSEV